MNYVVLAVPVFFLLIGLELLIARLQEKDYYSLSDSVADLGCGLVSQLVEVALKTSLFAGYLLLYQRWRQFEIPVHSVAAWAGARSFREGAPINAVARMLGVRSLDRAARTIGWDWLKDGSGS